MSSCDQHNERREYYEGGEIKTKVSLKDGLKEGLMMTYSSTGKLISKHTYHRDSMTGPYEVYFPDGKLAERGKMRNGLRVGKVYQYYPGSQLHYEHYMLTVHGRPFPYYTIEFDSLGKLISNNKRVNVSIKKIGDYDYHAELMILEDYEYESIKLVWGNFDQDFRPLAADSIVLNDKAATIITTRVEDQEFLRGYLIRYKTVMRGDTIVNFKSYAYFEHPF